MQNRTEEVFVKINGYVVAMQSFLPFADNFEVNKEDQTEYLTPDTILRCFTFFILLSN